MAKIVKATREVLDVNAEIDKVSSKKKNESVSKTKSSKKEKNKKEKKTKKTKGKIRTFFMEVKDEMSKVKWLNKKDMAKYSVATVVFILFFAIFFYLINIIMAYLEAMV